VSKAVALVSGALRHKLSREGVASLSAVEWHLLRVSQFLDALDRKRLKRLLAATPLAELQLLAQGLEAIDALDCAEAVRLAVDVLTAINKPGHALQRDAALGAITAELDAAARHARGEVEQKLLDYAFRQPELAGESGGDG
jgi:hypothetical protein